MRRKKRDRHWSEVSLDEINTAEMRKAEILKRVEDAEEEPQRRDVLFVRIFPVMRHMNIPNVITTLGLVFGIFACYFLTRGEFRNALLCIFMAGVMDLIDGYVAAKLGQTSSFGRHVDTLVDFFVCVIIPIWMVFDLLGSSPLIVAPMILYCICGLWRLANYNISEGGVGFAGLPVPGAMMMITITIWCVVHYPVPLFVASIMFTLMALLMISGIKLKKYGL